LVIVGGAPGMAGATILAARAAMRSGVGMVRLVVAPESLPVVQAAEPFALAGTWPLDDASLEREIVSWADGVVIGPGLGRTPASLRGLTARRWYPPPEHRCSRPPAVATFSLESPEHYSPKRATR